MSSISDPFEGQVVDNDQPFVVTGVGTRFEGNIVTTGSQRLEGTDVVEPQPTIASGEDDQTLPLRGDLRPHRRPARRLRGDLPDRRPVRRGELPQGHPQRITVVD